MEQNLNLYRIFYNTAKTGNISHAAKSLYISQPAVSKAISKLEEDLGTTLFVRKSRGVALTDEGSLLYEQLQIAFDAIHAGEEKIQQINTLGIGHLKIGASATFCKYLLIPYLNGFIKKYPHIKISIECQSTYHTLKLLENNKIDIALVVKPEDKKNIDFFSLGEFQDIFVATSTYLKNLNLREEGFFDSNEKFEAQLFKNANIMLLDEENITRLYVNEYLKQNNFEVNQVLEVTNMDLLIEFARIGLGVACVIREFVRNDLDNGKFTEIHLSSPIKKRTAGFAYFKNTPPTDPMNKFIQYYKQNRNNL